MATHEAGTQREHQRYLVVKGSLGVENASVFGLSKDEERVLSERFTITADDWKLDGRNFKCTLAVILNQVAELGYRVACHLGDGQLLLEKRIVCS